MRQMSIDELNKITEAIIGAAIEVHRNLGPGLLESAYRECLRYELLQREYEVSQEVPLPLIYKGVKLDCGYRLDILVENSIVLELKSVEALNEVHTAQILTYMRLGKFKIGYLMNFNVASLRNGIKRYVL